MKNVMEFLKTTLMGGFLILLPLLLLEMVLEELFETVVVLARPLADFLPGALGEADETSVATAVSLILLISFLLGLVGRSETGRRLGGWIERHTLERFPPYRVLKGLAACIVDFGESTQFQPALYENTGGERIICYLVEAHDDGWTTILEPWAPTPMAGSVRIVPSERVVLLDAKFGRVTEVLTHWGIGSRQLRRVEGSA